MNKKNLFTILFLIIFIELIVLIKTNSIDTFDLGLYNLVTINMNDTLTSLFKSITFVGSGLAIASSCVISVIITVLLKRKRIGFIIALCVTFNSLFSEGFKYIIARPRPEILQLASESSYSFPSSHTLASVSLCGILIYFAIKSKLDKRVKIVLTILLALIPFLIGISRIYLGVHNASDVIGGFALAMILLLIEIDIIEKKNFLKEEIIN